MTETLTAHREQIKPATFTVDGPAFAEAIAPVVKCTMAGKYAAVTLSFRDQRVTVAATSLEAAASIKVPVKGKKATSIAVDPARLTRFAKMFPLGDVTIDVSADGVKFTIGSTELSMPPVWDAPVVDIPAHTEPADVEMARLATAVRICAETASVDQTRPALLGILFDAGHAVATDSYRLAVCHTAPSTLSGLFPAAALKVSVAMFADYDEVLYEIVDRHLVLRAGDRAFALRQIDAEYPKWRNLMEQPEARTVVTVARKALMASLDKIVLAGDKESVCRAQIEAEHIYLTVQTQDVAQSFDPLDVVNEGDLALIGFRPVGMRSMLSGVEAETLCVRIVDALKPITIVPADADDTGFELLQMPIRL